MTDTMLLIDNLVEGGRYIIGYVANGKNIENGNSNDSSYNVVYKCYIPNGEVVKVPEMSKYFFYNQLKNHGIKNVVITSKECSDFLGDLASDYRACEYSFEKIYS